MIRSCKAIFSDASNSICTSHYASIHDKYREIQRNAQDLQLPCVAQLALSAQFPF